MHSLTLEPMRIASAWRGLSWVPWIAVALLWGAAACSESASRNVIGGPGIGVAAVFPEDAGDSGAGLEGERALEDAAPPDR